MKKVLVVDMRGLNYSVFTGINTLTIHVLYQLWLLKQEIPLIKIVGVGLRKQRLTDLKEEFWWFEELVDEHVSIQSYLGMHKLMENERLIKMINFAMDFSYSFFYPIFKRVFSTDLTADLVWIPQPKGFAWSKGARIITTTHDLFAVIDHLSLGFFHKARENKNLYSRLLGQSSYVFSPSLSTCYDVSKILGTDENKIRWVKPALPIWETIRSMSEPSENNIINSEVKISEVIKTKYIFTISGIEARKNWINLILAHGKAWHECDCYRNVQLVLAGYPVDARYLHFLKEMIVKEKIPNVLILNSLSDEDKYLLMECCLFFVYPSLYEGFGFPLLEAFRYSKAALTSLTGSMPEVTQNAGLFVNPHDISEIARGLVILSKDESFRKKLEKSAGKILESYSWEETKQAWEKILTE